MSYVQQGIDYVGFIPFLTLSDTSINLVLENNRIDFVLSHKDSNYLFSETKSVNSAWSLPQDQSNTAYLLWTVDLPTGRFTRTTTYLKPHISNAEPTKMDGQYWYNPETKIGLKYVAGNSNNWIESPFVIAAAVLGGNILSPISFTKTGPFVGTQACLPTVEAVGQLVFDSNGHPIRLRSGSFLTTNDTYFINDQHIRVNPEMVILSGITKQPIPHMSVVSISGKLLEIANYNTNFNNIWGFVEIGGPTNSLLQVATLGIITNSKWDWPNNNEWIWVSENGTLTTNKPIVGDNITPIGKVLTNTSIYFFGSLKHFGVVERALTHSTTPDYLRSIAAELQQHQTTIEQAVEQQHILSRAVSECNLSIASVTEAHDFLSQDVTNLITQLSILTKNVTRINDKIDEIFDKFDKLTSQISELELSKQDLLIGSENIKLINGENILGSGNIVVENCQQRTSKTILVEENLTLDPNTDVFNLTLTKQNTIIHCPPISDFLPRSILVTITSEQNSRCTILLSENRDLTFEVLVSPTVIELTWTGAFWVYQNYL